MTGLPAGFKVVSKPPATPWAPANKLAFAPTGPVAAPSAPAVTGLPPGFKVVSKPRIIADTDPLAGLALPGTITQVQIDRDKAAREAAAAPPPVDAGPMANLSAGLQSGLVNLMSAPGWAFQTVSNAGAAMQAANAGQDVDRAIPYPNADGGKAAITALFEKAGIHDPDQVKATTLASKLIRSFGENATLVGAPETVLPKLAIALKDAGIVGDDAVRLTQAIVGEGKSGGQVLKDATIGGVAGATGQEAADHVPDQYKPLVQIAAGLGGGIAAAGVAEGVPAVLKGSARAVSDIVAPLHEDGRENIVGRKLRDSANDPAAVIGRLETPTEGDAFKPTTAQKSDDLGVLTLEKASAVKDQTGAFNARRGEQNQLRTDATREIQPYGASESVIPALRDHLAAIDDVSSKELEAAHAKSAADIEAARQQGELQGRSAQAAAQRDAAAIGQPIEPGDAGAAARSHLETAREAVKVRERAIWSAVDPQGKLALETHGTTDAVGRITAEMSDKAKPMEGEEAALFKTAAELKPVEKLSDIQALQGRTKAAMREEVFTKGETPAYRRLSQLNHALQSDLETAVSDVVAHEKQAVAAGTMSPAETMLSRLAKERDDFLANRHEISARATGSGDLVDHGGAGPVAVRGAPGAEGPALDGSRAGQGAQRLAGNDLEANLDEAALGRLTEARAATKDRVETFDNKTLAPLRKRNGDVPAVGDSSVPGRIFHPGPKAFDDVTAYRHAVGDGEAMANLEGYAIDRLHRVAMQPDGTLDPAKVATWRKNHSDALRAFPELDARIRRASASAEAVKEAAVASKARTAAAESKARDETKVAEKKAKDAKSEAESGAIGKIVKADGPEEVVNHVGKVFERADSAREMARLRQATHGDKNAQQGLRKAIVDHILKKFVSNAESGVSGTSTIKSDAFQTFVREQEHALRAAGFSEAEVQTLKEVAASLRQANRSIVATKIPGGSDTVQNAHSAAVGKGRALLQFLTVSLATAGGGEVVHAPQGWGLAAGVLAAVAATVRAHGMTKVDQLLREALLDPALAAKLMRKVGPKEVKTATAGLMEALRPSRVIPALGEALGDAGKHAKRLIKDESGAGHIGTGTRRTVSIDDGAKKAQTTDGKEPNDVGSRAGKSGVREQAQGSAGQPGDPRREADGSLIGLPRKAGGFYASSAPDVQKVASSYMEKAGLPYSPPNSYAKADPKRAARIADAYEAMKHDPQDPEVKAAYQAMIDETTAQYQHIVDSGVKFEFIEPGAEDPYKGNPRNMTEDVRNNKHMWVFPTRSGFGSDTTFDVADNPLLADTKFKISGQTATVNDLFRGVHDYFGHVKEGVGFRADGEENAWRSHSAMYSPLARRAMTSETRGQNSWVNFGPKGEANRTAKSEDTHYADQKIGLLPEWVVSEGAGDVAASRLEPGGDHPDRISTRVPSLKTPAEDVLTGNLTVGLKSMEANPTAFAHNMELVKDYPGVAIKARDPKKIAEQFVDQVSANLRHLYDAVPAKTRERSKLWYEGARKITERWSSKYDLPDHDIAGVLASLSPQKDWFQNVSLAERVLDVHTRFSRTGADGMATPEMKATVKRIFDKPQYEPGLKVVLSTPYAELTDPIEKAMWLRAYDEAHHAKAYRTVSPEGDFIGEPAGNVAWGSLVEIAKAIKVLQGSSRETVSAEMGAKHKVRNFYNNIVAPNAPHGDVTIDTHAVAAALMRPLSGSSPEVLHNFGSSPMKAKQPEGWQAAKSAAVSGSEGTYGLFAEAYRREAKKLGILPRELQSITWEAVRGLFSPTFKRNKVAAAAIDAIWADVKRGKTTAEEARNAITKLAGGVSSPEWYRPGGHVPEEAQTSSYAGKLEGSGVPERPKAGVGGRDSSPDVRANGRAAVIAPARA